MKKILGFLLIIILGVALLTGCGAFELFNGTTVSRIMKSGDWIYYVNIKEDALFKMKSDMTEKTKIADITDYMVIQGDTIYFFDAENGISRIGTDGTGYAKVADLSEEKAFGFYVSDGWIYYGTKTGSIYKMRTDGTAKAKVADISAFYGDMNVSGDWIYYKDGNTLSKMKTDGSGATKLSENVELFEVKDDWVYYGEAGKKGEYKTIYRMKLDGTEKSKIVDGVYTAIDGDWLYYGNEGWLCRANLDGSEAEKLNDVKLWSIYGIYDGYIYYGEYSGAAYRIDLDGSNKVRIE